MVKIQNFVIWIKDSFIVHVKTGDIYKDFQGMLRQDLTLQILKYTDHHLKEKLKK